MSILEIKEYKSVDLNNPKEALDYLIYLTEDSARLMEISLAHCPDKILLKKFFKEFQTHEHKMGYLIGYGSHFYDTFINISDSFIFDSYFFGNTSTSDIEKTAKINRLAENIKRLLCEIRGETKTENLIKPKWKEGNEQIENFKNKFPNFCVINGIKGKQYSYKLLKFYFGVYLNKMFEKVITNYVGFIKEPAIDKYLPSTQTNKMVAKNPFPETFKSIEIYKNFLEYTTKQIIEPYKDYSYLFQRLKKEELIHDMKHKKFIDWLFSEDLINEKDYDLFINNGGFRSYSKSYHVERENNFNNVFKI